MMIYNKKEVSTNSGQVLKMVINKINVFIRDWYYQLWNNEFDKANLKFTDEQKRILNILYKDIEKYFMNT